MVSFLFEFCRSENPLCFYGMSDIPVVSNVPLCFVYIVRRSKGGWTAFRMGVGHSWKEQFFPPLQRCTSIFSSQRRANTGLNHVVRVSNHIQYKKTALVLSALEARPRRLRRKAHQQMKDKSVNAFTDLTRDVCSVCCTGQGPLVFGVFCVN